MQRDPAARFEAHGTRGNSLAPLHRMQGAEPPRLWRMPEHAGIAAIDGTAQRGKAHMIAASALGLAGGNPQAALLARVREAANRLRQRVAAQRLL